MKRNLDVYLFDHLVGNLLQDETGRLSFSYSTSWLSSAVAQPLSQSLPLRQKSFATKECRPFFTGVLPEEHQRELIARNLGISARNDFALLEKIGGECAGAVSFLPAGQPFLKTQRADYRLLSESDLMNVLNKLSKRPLLAGEEGVRLSLAGAQDKISINLIDGQMYLPLHGVPSSHIIKPAIPAFEGVSHNEAFCMQLANSVGIPTAAAAVHHAGNREYLLVTRYDRIAAEGKLERLHQEDFCQALGIAPEFKYQNEGGPKLAQCFELLRHCSSLPVIDIRTLLDAAIFNYLIGNNDAHGKNFSLLYTAEGARLAPLYDVLSTTVYPELTHKMAMKIGDTYDSNRVSMREWEKLAAYCGLGAAQVRNRLKELAENINDILVTMEVTHPIVKEICTTIRQRGAFKSIASFK